MRELQSILNNYISNTEKQKRHLAVLVTLSLLVSFIVPYILVEPADSLTKQALMLMSDEVTASDGVTIVSEEAEKVKLLVGANNPEITGSTVAETISLARSKYLLGIASQFGVFLEGDFTDHSADVESRLAVGGGANLSDTGSLNGSVQKGFEVGNGDFIDKISLEKLINNWDFAHAIVGTGPFRMINTVPHDDYTKLDGTLGKLDRLFVIGSNVDLSDTSTNHMWNNDAYDVSKFRKTNEPLIDFAAEFAHIRNISEKLSEQVTENTELVFSAGVKNIQYDSYKNNIVALESLDESKYWDGNIAHFRYAGEDTNVVKFNITYEEWLAVSEKCSIISYEGIPENANIIINVASENENVSIEVTPQYKFTLVNGIQITPGDLDIGGKVELNYTVKNNDEYCEKILYNFSTATSLEITQNFSGNILAPNADVTGANKGHLSGSLVAKSFTGEFEFGYRPYQGTIDLLGSTAGYVVPFDKLAPNNEHLEGATFVIIDETGKIVESWTSGEGTQYITLPSEVDLEGGTDYTAADAVTSVTHSYTVEEQSAPEGYIKTDEFYTIVITETIDTSPDALIRTESGTLPTRILVYLDLYKGEADDANLLGRRVVTIEDTYSDEGIIQRIVCIENESAKQYFVLDINSQDGSINSVGVPTDPSVLEDDEVESVLDDLTVDYLKPEVLEDEETGDGTDGEGTDSEDTDDSTEGEGAEGETSLFPEGYIEPTGLTATYGQTLADVVFPEVSYGSWSWIENWQTVGDVGTKTFRATFTPTVEGYTQQEVQLEITVEPATPTPPGPYTVPYGTYLYNIQLPSDANGSWSWQNSNQTGNNLYEFLYQANYTPNNGNYKAISVDVSVTFTKSDPPYNLPNNLTATYGQTLADVTLPYADNGTWSWQADTTTSVGPAGTNTFIAVFTPNDTNYNTVTPTVQITVNKADPNCTFPTDLTTIYGQILQNVILPTADNGRFEWENPWNQVGNVGTPNHRLKFIPNDQNNFNTLIQDVPVRVEKADPNYTIPTGLTVTYGSKLSSVTLPSGWTWDAPDTDVPGSAGSTVIYSATFTPSDTNNYNIINADITLTIEQATPTVNPVYDKDTTYTQFDALPAISITEGDTPGTIQWSDKNASKLKYGENVLEWVFTPTDSTNYKTTTGTITITAEAIETTPITITDSKTEEVIKYEEVNYYYDPTSMMIMPLPDETPKFINEYGLVFKKLDDQGNLLKGADIQLQSGTIVDGSFVVDEEAIYNANTQPPWYWNSDSSSYTIPSTKIPVHEMSTGIIYRFFEVSPPSDEYETAKPIYFVKTGESTIRYTDDETLLGNTDSWKPLDLTQEQTIAMTDYQIYGAAVTLKKTDSTGTVSLDGAEFELHALKGSGSVPVYPVKTGEDGKLVLDDSAQKIGVSNGGINLYDFFKSVDFGTYNSTYVKNGYLVPGAYYLNETKAPNGYEAPTGEFYFTIEENETGDGYVIKAEKVEVPDYINFAIDSSNSKEIWARGTAENVTKIEILVTGATEIVLYEGPFAYGTSYFEQKATVVDGIATITNVPSSITADFKIQSIPYADLTVNEVRVYGEGESSDSSGSSGSGVTAHNLSQMAFTGTSTKPDYVINLITVYYGDGSQATLTSPTITGGNYWHPIDMGNLAKENVIGITFDVTGTGNSNICIQNPSWQDVWNVPLSGTNIYTAGVTSIPTDDSNDTNDTSESEDTEETEDTEVDNSNLININGMEISIGNNAKGQNTSIEVVKNWADDGGFTKYRPESITVQLYQSLAPGAEDKTAYGDPITLSEENGWKYTWSKIPGLVAGTTLENPSYYYYSIAEITPDEDYTVSYSNNGGIDSGSITITNTLKTIDLPVEKIWDTKNNTGITIPDSVTIKLQKKSGDNWIDVDVEPIILNKDNNWKGTFENLPEGETYRAFEENVPNGWLYSPDEVGTSVDGTTLTVTNNLDVGRLTISKIWLNDAAGNRPGSIKLNIYRTTKRPGSGTSGGGSTGGGSDVEVEEPENTKYATVTEDYARLLQYSLYFYDANMCGDEVGETSVLSWRDNCHTNDAVVGGFHDAGDHAIFGLPEGFTASTLGWSYYEYKNTFDSLGLTNHFKIIMKEFCDFFTDSTTITNGEVTRFLYQKGDGGTDHSYWGAPETQPSRSSQMFYTTNGASDIAADYAAALAQYALIFPSDSNSQTYLETAEALFDFSTKYNTRTSEGASGFYWDGNGSCNDEQAWAAAWLYLATKDDSYKTACETKLNSCGAIPERGHFWDDVTLGAECVYNAHINPNSANASEWSKVTNYLNTYCTGDSYRVLNSWGSTRHNTLLQLAALVTDKNMKTTNYQAWCKSQMAYILGNNSIASNGNSSTCFVAGFASNSSKYPHHRAASGYASGETRDNSKYDTDGHVLLGALIGGPNAGGGYVDKMDGEDLVWQTNEVTIDYNAGLVGAAAALYSVYGTGHTVTEDVMVADGLELRDGMHIYEYSEQPAALDLSDMDFNFDKVSVMADNSLSVSGSGTNDTPFVIDISSLVAGDVLRVVFTGNDANYTAVFHSGNWVFQNYSKEIPANTETEVLITIESGWGDIMYVRNYWYGGSTYPTIVASNATESTPKITLSPTSKTAKIGDTFQITATGTTNTINWTSSDTNIAEVDENGNVTIKAMPTNGNTVRITATDSVDSSATAYIDVTIEAMTLSPNSSSIVVGDTVTYSSNYSNAVIQSGTGYSVSGNTITAESEGNHTVTANAGNASATATINVSKLAITGSSTVDSGAKPTFGVNGQTDNHSFKWESSDPTVLSIDNSGNAQAHKSGTVKLTVTKDGKYTSDEFSVTVQKGALSISVDPTQIRVGDTATLSAVNNEGQTVNYSSSDDNIATISGNTITAVGAGTVTITGTLGNENPTCTLEILAAPTITAPENQNLMGTGDKLQLTASNIIGTANWTSNKPEVLTVDPATGLVTAVSNGTAKIRVTDSKDNAFAEYEITVTLIADDPEIPEGLVSFMSITLTDADLKGEGTWSRVLENLPKTDGNGNKYYYYIAELDSSGQIAESITGTGAIYIPMLYEGNGSALGDNTELSVSNKLSQEIQGQMPSTGGEGTEPYYIYGIILMLCSLAGYVVIQLRRGRRS